MLERPPREKEWLSWCFVGLWSLIIFVTIPLARSLQAFVAHHFGRAAFMYFVLGCIVLAGTIAVMYLLRRTRASQGNYVWLLGTSAIFIGYTIYLKANPEEALHFVQYGILGILIYRAWSHHIHDRWIYAAAISVGASIGILDETIQWVTPNRFWGLGDIWLNCFAVSLTQLAIARGMNPALISQPLQRRSLRLVVRTTVVPLLLLGATLLNTPERIAWYANRVPFLAFLKTNASVMFEYGYLYVDPDIGRFRSRLTPDELRRHDIERAEEVADIIDRFHDRSAYKRFLSTYNPITDPFAHEARVHLFRRDRFLQHAKRYQEQGNQDSMRESYTVSYREHQIMETYFHHTLYRSNYVLPVEQVELMKQHALLHEAYTSRVSRYVITSFSEKHVVSALVLLLIGLVLVDRYGGNETSRRRNKR